MSCGNPGVPGTGSRGPRPVRGWDTVALGLASALRPAGEYIVRGGLLEKKKVPAPKKALKKASDSAVRGRVDDFLGLAYDACDEINAIEEAECALSKTIGAGMPHAVIPTKLRSTAGESRLTRARTVAADPPARGAVKLGQSARVGNAFTRIRQRRTILADCTRGITSSSGGRDIECARPKPSERCRWI